MELDKHKQKLIDEFINEELSGEKLVEFQKLMNDDASFADHAMEQTYTAAAIETIGERQQKEKSKSHSSKVKQLWIRSISVAAVIALLIVMGSQIKQVKDKPIPVITKTDTVYLPKSEYYILPNAIAPVKYAQNIQMENLVEQTNIAMRSSTDEICLPANGAGFDIGEQIDFELLQFKPAAYKLEVLAFHEQITAVDTIFNGIVTISENSKIAHTWSPGIAGTYYWMIYFKMQKNPYLVRRIIVNNK